MLKFAHFLFVLGTIAFIYGGLTDRVTPEGAAIIFYIAAEYFVDMNPKPLKRKLKWMGRRVSKSWPWGK